MNDLERSARDKAYRLEQFLRQMPQAEIPERHYFAPGIYAREITMPKGAVVVGKLHKCECMHTVSKGDVSVLTDEGVVRMTAPYTFVSKRGAKRVFMAHEETVWTMYHATTETDIDRIEEIFIAKDEAEYLAFVASMKITEG